MRKLLMILGILAVTTALFCMELLRSNSSIEVEPIALTRPDLPPGFDGFKIAHVSDLHMRQFGADNVDLCEIIAGQNVDIIVITGDYVNNSRSTKGVYATAKNLVATAPTYYVPGNHEYAGSFAAVQAELIRAGVTVLRNQAVELERNGDRIVLLGIDDPNGPRGMLTVKQTVELARQREPEFILALYHRYDDAQAVADLGVQIMMSGHAHGGIVRLPFTDGVIGPGRVILPKNTSGLYQIGEMSLVVSRGLGNTGMSMRIFNKFHLPIVTLELD